jgi:cellulose synthase operon protein C
MHTWLRRPRDSRARSLGAALATAVALHVASAAAAGMAEEWYLLRARANMQIRHYKAAIEAYRKAIEENPLNREALLGLGDAYEANGQTDDAISAYDRYLAHFPDDADVALKQARTLRWSRYAYRRSDAIRYYRAALKRRDDPSARRELAELLARDKATLEEALEHYRILLRQRPGDASLRAEYRKLLLWDPQHLSEAIAEYTALAAERPDDPAVQLELARLLAREPRRTDEAIAQYQKVIARSPKDRSLRIEYAHVLARDPLRRAEALEQLRVGMGRSPDRGTRVLYADLLAASEDTREEALERYRALLAEKPQDVPLRLKYARLLGARAETSHAAIPEYERILASEPKNGEAHAGLARALAWNGENDRALHHARLARRYGYQGDDMRALEESLGREREPRVGAGLAAVIQPGEEYALYGFRAPMVGRTDLSAFVTAWAEAGYEEYRGSGTNGLRGAFVDVRAEIRFSRTLRTTFGAGYRSLLSVPGGLTALAELEHRTEAFVLRPRLERRPRMDSFAALASGVTENRLSLQYEWLAGPWRASIAPAASLIAARGGRLNTEFELEGAIELELLRSDAWQLLIGYDAHGSHHSSDGSRPGLGGYFSPNLYAVQMPRLTVRHAVDPSHFVEVSGGPALQYQLLHSGRGGFLPGGQARAAGTFRLTSSLEWALGGSFARMGDAFSRFEASTSLSHLF